MPTFLDSVFEKAKSDKRTIVLPEGRDDRVLKAAEYAIEQGIADPILIGDPDRIAWKASNRGYKIDGAVVIDNKTSELREELAELLYEIRRGKVIDRKDALGLMDDSLYFGAMLLKTGRADGMVCGARYLSHDVMSVALRVIRTAPDCDLVSSVFFMVVPDCEYGDDGLFVFADCATVVQPNAEELGKIAIASAKTFENLTGREPKVAMLSHSTYGSARNADSEKVESALKVARGMNPDLQIDGALQVDAALDAMIGAQKAPGSTIAGKANVLIFPDLDSGNIGYKLVQRLGKAEAYGPIMQGLDAPVNDLSRGCTADDVLTVIAITVVQAQAQNHS